MTTKSIFPAWAQNLRPDEGLKRMAREPEPPVTLRKCIWDRVKGQKRKGKTRRRG